MAAKAVGIPATAAVGRRIQSTPRIRAAATPATVKYFRFPLAAEYFSASAAIRETAAATQTTRRIRAATRIMRRNTV